MNSVQAITVSMKSGFLLSFALSGAFVIVCQGLDAQEDPIPTPQVADTKFSLNGGFYEAPIIVALSSATPEATIEYTLDGSEPSLFNAATRRYSGPISIERTTVVRAQASKAGMEPTNLDTHTYLFSQSTLFQPKQPDGFPANWSNAGGINASKPADVDYEIDPRIREARYVDMDGEAFGLAEALQALPSMAITIPNSVLWDPDHGLHAQARNKGREWERRASVEYFDATGERLQQAEAGLRMQGGWNRNPEMLKKSLRLYFRKEYGDAKFRAPLFKDTPVDSFDTLILRSGNGKAWPSPWRALSGLGNSLERTTYLRDEFVRATQLDMGHPSAHGDFVHLYINGLYWGLYNLTERLDEHFGARYFPGEADDMDVIKWIRSLGRLANNGTEDVWESVLTLARGDVESPAVYDEIASLVDLPNLIDYMLVNFFVGNGDWPDNNAYTMRSRVEGETFRFFCWDSEECLLSPQANRLNVRHPGNLSELYQLLRQNEEFQFLISDRISRHFFDDGALTDTQSSARLMRLARRIDRAIVAESARWGDLLRPSQPYDRDDWLRELQRLREDYFNSAGNGRNAITLSQLESAGLWDHQRPPLVVQEGDVVRVKKRSIFASGILYFTTDGTDPRLPGGEIHPSAQQGPAAIPFTETLTIRARAKGLTRWTPEVEHTFVYGTAASAANLRITEIMYHPAEDDPMANEFIELMNTSEENVNLRGLRFIDGIDFAIAEDTLLAPGERALIVGDQEIAMNARVLGSFANDTRLSNSGERLAVASAEGALIHAVSYQDDVADGDGLSLEWHAATGTWLASTERGGTPGRSSAPMTPGIRVDANGQLILHIDPSLELQHSPNLIDWDTLPIIDRADRPLDASSTRAGYYRWRSRAEP